ncbi:hypothetical protein ACFIJ5_10935 [Haloimpatiens sp. FM7330]|uniref:hypothetical protein n=1 Tax=Haloimpatiens sp. FM7330 TaxID=3298610 RepID=UPI003644C20E
MKYSNHYCCSKGSNCIYICIYKRKNNKKKYEYDIDIIHDRKIKYVEFSYCKYMCNKCKRNKATIWLLVDGEPTDKKCLCQCPCRWDLNKKVSKLKLLSTKKLKPECIWFTVVYEEEQEWIELAPGASYPLPLIPPEISKITFDAKTDPGTSSEISILAYGLPLQVVTILETINTVNLNLGSTFPIDILSMTNTGSSPIYIRNLITE